MFYLLRCIVLYLSLFFIVLQSSINGWSNDHGLVIIFEVKIEFTCKFSVLAFKIYFKKNTKIWSKTVKKVPTIPKTAHFKKNIDVTDNGSKNVARYSRGTVVFVVVKIIKNNLMIVVKSYFSVVLLFVDRL